MNSDPDTVGPHGHPELKLGTLANVKARELLVLLWAQIWSMRYFRACVEEDGQAVIPARNGMKALQMERRMSEHISTIMLTLATVDASFAALLAGAVHDVVEWHPDGEVPLNRKLAEYETELAGIDGHPLNGRLMPLVKSLIEAVCEPQKAEVEDLAAWRSRKWAYIANLEMAEDDAVQLSIATKIHGLMELVDILCKGGKSEDWSKAGGRQGNIEFFGALLNLYQRRHVPVVLLEVFRHLLKVFVSFKR